MRSGFAMGMLAATVVSATMAWGFQTTASRKTVWTGVYTEAQAARGKDLYDASCANCHGQNLSGDRGSSLQGRDFMEKWREDNVETLFLFMKGSMPPTRRGQRRTPLPDETYVDIIAYVMKANAFPAGSDELAGSTLEGIQIESRMGPLPLPHGSRALVVGCMTRVRDTWVLKKSTEPVRTRNVEMSTSDEIKTAGTKPAGNYDFQLTNFGYLGSEFVPDKFEGQRILAKGMLVRQPNAERISLTSFTSIGASCSE